ncbi:MAG: SsrA-binding protein SmpB [Candidatus Moranbacteria bacterium]|nr:SsrA-binding protein SmpB [Candidatus Moranbacteria bacterium]
MKTLSINRRATFDYALTDRYEAGLMLTGAEVKSAKAGHMSLKGSFVVAHGNELFLMNSLISAYPLAHKDTRHEDRRSRKLLLRRSEIRSLIGKSRVEGLTLVPVRVYTKNRLVKLEFAVGKGKKQIDKRETIKKREARKDIGRAMREK